MQGKIRSINHPKFKQLQSNNTPILSCSISGRKSPLQILQWAFR